MRIQEHCDSTDKII